MFNMSYDYVLHSVRRKAETATEIIRETHLRSLGHIFRKKGIEKVVESGENRGRERQMEIRGETDCVSSYDV